MAGPQSGRGCCHQIRIAHLPRFRRPAQFEETEVLPPSWSGGKTPGAASVTQVDYVRC